MRFSELKWKIVKNSNFLIIRIFARKFNGKSPGCDLTTISNISKIPNFYSENPDFWHENSKFWWLKLSKSLSFFLLGGHISFLAIFFVFYTLSRHGVRKGITLTLGQKSTFYPKIQISKFSFLTKFHISKISFFTWFTLQKISHLTKFNPIIHEIHIFQGSDFGILKQKSTFFMEFEKLRFWSLGFEILEKCEVLKQRINEDFRTLDEFWKKRFEIRFLSERSEPRLSKKNEQFYRQLKKVTLTNMSKESIWACVGTNAISWPASSRLTPKANGLNI